MSKLATMTALGTRENYASGPPWTEGRDQFDTRIDHSFGDSGRLFGRFSKMRYNQRRESVLPLPARGAAGNNWAEDDNDAHTVAIGYTHAFSPSFVNETRIGYRRLKVDKVPLTPEDATELNARYDIKGVPTFSGVTGLTRFTFGGSFGFQGLGEANFAPNWKISEGIQYLDNVTWVQGNHTYKFGGDIRFSRSDIYGARNAHGQFNFNGKFTRGTGSKGVSLADFLLGWTNTFIQSNLHTGNQRFRSYMFYFQDDWKASPKLSLNLGIRYELTSPWFDLYDNMNKIDIDSASPTYGELIYAGQDGDSWSDRALVNTDTNNFAPRLGIAYRIADRTVLRAGGGMFYGGQESLGASARQVVNWPFHVRRDLRSTGKVPALMLGGGVPPGYLDPGDSMPSDSSLSYWSTDWPLPLIYQWNLSLQQQLYQNMVLKLAYVGSSTSHIRDAYDWNAPEPGDADTEKERRKFPDIAAINLHSPFAHASYHGLEASLQKRLASGFSFLANYTWGEGN